MASPIARVKEAGSRVRARRPFLDHLVRAYQRYTADTGDRLAAAVTFYWFLSLFPILLLAVSVLGYVVSDDATVQRDIASALESVLPSAAAGTILDVLGEAKGPAGVIGLVGLAYSGLGWIDALRESIRSIWHQNVKAGNIVVKKAVDLVVLVGLFATIATSVLVTGLATQATSFVLELLTVEETTPARVFTRLLAIGAALVADTVLFLYLFTRLAKVKNPLRRVLKAALFGAVGFELLKLLGGFYVERTTTKGAATYGAFAVVVGLLLFLNLVSRFLLLTAAFAVTAPYDSDVAPSGTADVESARRAGIPLDFVDHDPDDPPTLQEDGAPSRLRAVVQGRTPPQDVPEGRPGAAAAPSGSERPAARRRAGGTAAATAAAPAAGTRSPAGTALPAAGAVVLAGRIGAMALIAVVLVTVVLAVKTVVGLLRR